MKAVVFSLLAVILAVAPTNTEDIRDPRQTRTQCVQMIEDKEVMIDNTISEIYSACNSCSSTCTSLLNTFKNEIGCCLESYGNSAARSYVDRALELCGISPPGRCNHASSVVITFSTIAIFSIIAYFVNVF